MLNFRVKQHGPLEHREKPALWNYPEIPYAEIAGENGEWLDRNEDRLLAEHPDWHEKFVAVCTRTQEKVLAVEATRDEAFWAALMSQEVFDVAAALRFPLHRIINIALIGRPLVELYRGGIPPRNPQIGDDQAMVEE